MKKYVYTLMTILLAVLSSCSGSDENSGLDNNGNKQAVRFSITTPETLIRSSATIDRYVMEIYEDAACTQPANVFDVETPTNHKENMDGNFTVVLDRTKTYTCLFWADNNAANVYTVSDLRTVTLQSGAEAAEAFTCMKEVKGNSNSHTISLNRAVAKMTFLETDYLPAASTLTVKYEQKTQFDVLTGKVKGTAAERTKVFTINDVVNGSSATPVKLGELYTLACTNDVDKEIINVTVKLNSEVEKSIANIPLLANHNTNIKGEYGAQTSRLFTPSLDEGWGDADLEDDLSPVFFKFTVSDITATTAKAIVVPHETDRIYIWDYITEEEYQSLGGNDAAIKAYLEASIQYYVDNGYGRKNLVEMLASKGAEQTTFKKFIANTTYYLWGLYVDEYGYPLGNSVVSNPFTTLKN